jgi:uncharacterized protein YndB with AHSA1/START domain
VGVSRIEGEVVIDRPVSVVFDVVADERNEPAYNPRLQRVELLTGEPIGAGARFRAESGTGRRPVPMLIEYTEVQRPHRLASRTAIPGPILGMDIEGLLTFEAIGGATRMCWSWRIRPRGMWRLAGPLLAAVGRRRERAIWTGLKAYLEPPGPARA